MDEVKPLENKSPEEKPLEGIPPKKYHVPLIIHQDADGIWRRETGARVCGRKTRHGPCKASPLKGLTCCRIHGGASAKANMTHGLHVKGAGNTMYLEAEIQKHMEHTNLKDLKFAIASTRAIFERRLQEIKKRNEREWAKGEAEFIHDQIERLQKYIALSEKFKEMKLTEADHDWLAAERNLEELTERDAEALWRGIEFWTRAVERMVKIEDGLKLIIDIGGLRQFAVTMSAEVKEAVREVTDEKTAEKIQVVIEGRMRRMIAVQGTGAK